MRSDEDVVAGAAIGCGSLVLVPLLRTRAHAFTGWAGAGEVDVTGFVACGPDRTPRLLALDDALVDASAWSAWLAARPTLVAAIRERLAAFAEQSDAEMTTPDGPARR